VSESEDGRSARRVAKHRSELRHKGLKPGQIWVADTSSGDTAAALELVCLEINAADQASGDAEFAYALSEEE
jgi:thiamine monophosphate kinase